MKPLPYLFCLLLIPALACSTTSIAENLVPSGGVLYQDFFSNPESGWEKFDTQVGKTGYVDGAYHIFVEQPNINIWTHPGKNFSTVKVEVSIMPFSGQPSNRMGVICRLEDDKNFYFFNISADGYYGIGKMKNGQTDLLTGGEMLPHKSILTGGQINRVSADCNGNLLSLYVNNILVSSTKDSDFTTGDVGIMAGSFDQPGVDIYFDNFIVFKP